MFKYTTYDKKKDRIYGEKSDFFNFGGEVVVEIIKHLYGELATVTNIPAVKFNCERGVKFGIKISFQNLYEPNSWEKRQTERTLNVPPRVVWQTTKAGYVNCKKIKEIVTNIQENTSDYIKNKKAAAEAGKKLAELRDSLTKDLALNSNDRLYVGGTAEHPSISLTMNFDNITAVKEMYKLGRHILSL